MSDRAARTVQVTNDAGLGVVGATKLVQLANMFPCDVRLTKDGGRDVNAKSIMGVLMLTAAKGSTLTITASGDGADAAVDALAQLVIDKFGETS